MIHRRDDNCEVHARGHKEWSGSKVDYTMVASFHMEGELAERYVHKHKRCLQRSLLCSSRKVPCGRDRGKHDSHTLKGGHRCVYKCAPARRLHQ